MVQWPVAFFAVIGAFVTCGVAGNIAATAIGLWGTPVAGFFAALGVVCIAYAAAPRRKYSFAVVCFILGFFLSYWMLGRAYYPESYQDQAYQPTIYPLAVTVGGGLLGLLAVTGIQIRHQRQSESRRLSDDRVGQLCS